MTAAHMLRLAQLRTPAPVRNLVAALGNSLTASYGSTMTNNPNQSPTDPADVEAHALEWLVAIPRTVVKSDAAIRPALQDIAGLLQLEGVFGGLVWPDAQRVAILLLLAVVNCVDPVAALRDRAHLVLTEGDEDVWGDRAEVVRSMNVAASVLDM
jgi:hypothetical protein